METRCKVCGAPLKGGKCEYCGYKAEEIQQKSESANTEQTTRTQEQPQVNVNLQLNNVNSINGGGTLYGISPKSKLVTFLLFFSLDI